MKKKVISAVLIFVMVFGMCSTVSATDVISVFYNGEMLVFDVDPVIIEGRTMVPMRAIFEAFGASVEYRSQTKQIVATKGSLVITLTISNEYATISKNGVITECTLDAAPIIIDGRTMVPLRFIGESLGSSVNWNGTTKTITIVCTDPVLNSTEIAKLMAPKSIIIRCYDSEDNLIDVGSGFFINSSGHIVTSYHVIAYVDRAVAVTSQGTEYDIQNVIYADRDTDLVVLSINKTGTDAVELGEPGSVNTGNDIYTYSSPLGIANTISEGIVSNSSVYLDGISYIQFSAPVSPGSSGGALVDECGKVIGVISSSFIEGQNMNLAVPVSYLLLLLAQDPLDQTFSEFQDDISTGIYFYESEPNDTKETSQRIYGYIPILGTVDDFGDLDFYRIEATEPVDILIAAFWPYEDLETSAIDSTRINIMLLDQYGGLMSTGVLQYIPYEEPGTGFYAKEIICSLIPGTYYICVNVIDNQADPLYTGLDYYLYYMD